MAQRLGDVADGRVIKLKENGVLVDFYVAKHDYENGLNGSGRTLIVRKDCYDTRKWNSSNVNTYASSDIDTWLNGTYKNLLDADFQSVIGTTKFYYTPGNGSNNVTTLSRAVFLLSVTELGEDASDANTEGSALPIASTLRVAYRNGSAAAQWTRSPRTDITAAAYFLTSGGNVNTYNCSLAYGSRPAFTLPSTLSVSDEGIVSPNTAPVISSSYASGTNLGTKTAGFNFNYTVSDADGDSLTVTEQLDGVTERSFTATSGSTQTFQAVTAANFQKVLNGSHTMSVVVSDGKDSVTFTATFTKAVYTANITLAEPLSVAGDIEVALLSVSGSIPEDANYKVEVTNNAKDNSPVWQDCTEEVKAGENIVFANRTNTNGAAFNFRITVSRGASGVGGYIDAVRGAFQ